MLHVENTRDKKKAFLFLIIIM